jgi:hypothetical protein
VILGQDDKPPLDELVHFGVKGMHWGVRRDRETGGRSGGAAPTRSKKAIVKKVAIGVGIAAGVAATAYILSKRGGTKVPHISTGKSSSLDNLEKVAGQWRRSQVDREASLKNLEKVAAKWRNPSPFEMRMQAGMAEHRNLMNRIGNQRLTDKAWRDAAKISRINREMDATTANLLKSTGQRLARGG